MAWPRYGSAVAAYSRGRAATIVLTTAKHQQTTSLVIYSKAVHSIVRAMFETYGNGAVSGHSEAKRATDTKGVQR